MKLFYSVAIQFYALAVKIAALFNEKARLFVNGRKNWEKHLKTMIKPGERYIWFHCASLGEFEQGRPVIEAIKNQFPHYKIVLTFFSPSGYEIRKNYQQTDVVAYLPIDTKKNATRFIDIVQPEKVFFVKYEYWYFYITELKRRGIPLYVFSCIFRNGQPFFSSSFWGRWFRGMLSGVDHFFVQNQVSCDLLKSTGLNNYTISGDTRFDRVDAIAKSAKDIPVVEKFKGDSLLVVAGSSWKPDEEILAEFINQSNKVKFIIAPHEVSPANISRIQQLLQKKVVLFSKAVVENIKDYDVIIVDSIGLLSSLYRYGNVAYIGGGFGVGIHNILEAATHGMPVIFGPNYKRFREAVELEKLGGAFPIHDAASLKTILSQFINDSNSIKTPASICKNYVIENVGATKIIVEKVFNI